MAITRWDPFTVLARFDREFDDLVRRGWGAPATPGSQGSLGNPGNGAAFVPAVEVLTRGTDAVVRLELPGVDVDRDVEVTVDKGRLVIRGERRAERSAEEGAFVLRELRYGAFHREFALPEGLTGEHVEAHYDQGMLEVVVHQAVRPEPEPVRVPIGTRQAIEQ